MKKILFSILAAGLLGSCSSDNDFIKGKSILENEGFSDIENTGHKFFCCSEKDSYSTGFKAKNKKGETVTGCFCSSLTKGITIRFE
jgi:hypothetical protein